MSQKDEAEFIVGKLEERFPEAKFEVLQMKDGSHLIASSQPSIYTNKGQRRKYSDSRIKKAILELHNFYISDHVDKVMKLIP